MDGEKLDYLPASAEDQARVKPIYKIFKGWMKSTLGTRNYDELPHEAKVYLSELEDFIGAKISSISTSPERDDTILVENPFKL